MRPTRLPTITLLAGALLAACAHHPKPPPLTPAGALQLREGYRVWLPGPAVVLPIFDCNSLRPDVEINIAARQLVAVALPGEVWKQLGLTGAPLDGRLPESDKVCTELVNNRTSGTNIDMASPVMREEVRDVFNRHPDESYLIIVAHTLRLGDRRPGPGGGVGALAGRIVETGTLQASIYVYAQNGDIAFRGDLECSVNGPDERHDCGTELSKTHQRVAEMLEGFPRSVLTESHIVPLPPEEPAKKPEPKSRAHRSHKKAAHRH